VLWLLIDPTKPIVPDDHATEETTPTGPTLSKTSSGTASV
jgi:hypothetical protein